MTSAKSENVKIFMKKLLIDDSFDSFLFAQGNITTYNRFEIDGHVEKEYFGEDYDISPLYNSEYTPWSQIKTFFKDLIKGKYTPLSFKFILYANEKLTEKILSEVSPQAADNISHLVLTIRYDERGLYCITATDTREFTTDKSAGEVWDKWIISFLSQISDNLNLA